MERSLTKISLVLAAFLTSINLPVAATEPALRPPIESQKSNLGGTAGSSAQPSTSTAPGTSASPSDTVSAPELKPALGTGATSGDAVPADILKQPDTTSDPDPFAKPTGQDASKPRQSGTITFDASPSPSAVLLHPALDEALVNSPRAAAIRSELQISRAEFMGATEQPNPGLFFDRGFVAEAVRRVGPALEWEPPWKVVFRLLVAKQLVDQVKLDLMNRLWSLRADVRHIYTEVTVAQETVETLNNLYDLASRLQEVSQKRFQAGDVPELDVLKARLASAQTDVDRKVGMRRLIRAKQQLNIILGRPAENPIDVPRLPAFLSLLDEPEKVKIEVGGGLLPDFSKQPQPLQHYIELGYINRWELKSLAQQLKLNKARLVNAVGDIVPNPQVGFGCSTAGNPPSGPKLTSVYLGFNVPFPTNNFNQGDLARLKATKRQLTYAIDGQKNVVVGEISDAYNTMLAAREKIRVYQEHVLKDSYEVARLARRSYEVGQSDINATLLAQQANIQIRNQYLEAISAYQHAFTDLEKACGKPLY